MKKLIPAICMLLVSVMLLGTSTYAWFSMNNKVTATGMAITAKSNQSFMMIMQGSKTLKEVQGGKKQSDDAINSTAAVEPVAHKDKTAVNNITTADTIGNWYYKTSSDPDLSTGSAGESAENTIGVLSNYVLVNTFSIALADGSNDVSNVTVSDCKIETANAGKKAINVLVASEEGCIEFDDDGQKIDDKTTTAPLKATLTDKEVLIVKVYVYWDGEDAEVKTNNMDSLLSTSVSLEFTGTVSGTQSVGITATADGTALTATVTNGTATAYQWSSSNSEDGEYTNVQDATSATYTGVAETWYKCTATVGGKTYVSAAVQAKSK